MTGSTALHAGLLLMRLGIGAMFMIFGFPKLTGGPSGWESLGGAMAVVGIGWAPAFWGFMAAVSEFVGGLALVLGILVRPFAVLMTITMVVAVAMLKSGGAPLLQYGHALDMAIVFAGLTVAGGGRFALGALIKPQAGRWWQ